MNAPTPGTLEHHLHLMCAVDAITADERDRHLAELLELRRCRWNWREARRVVASHQAYPEYRTLTDVKRDLLILVAGDGNAEWQQKAGQP